MKIIILADDHPIFLAGMARMIAHEDDMRIVAQCTNNEDLLRTLKNFRFSIAVVASSLQMDIPGLVRAVHTRRGKLVIIAENAEPANRYPTAKIDGVLSRNASNQSLVDCINKVADGRSYRQQMLHHGVADELDAAGERVRDRLTRGEIKIVGLIAVGHKNKEIANHLGTTEQVIKNRLKVIYDKVGVYNRLELALFTVQHRTLATAAASAAADL
ncbi:MAG: response regulator transcription factor [Acidobacteriaceae bacterium]